MIICQTKEVKAEPRGLGCNGLIIHRLNNDLDFFSPQDQLVLNEISAMSAGTKDKVKRVLFR